MTAPKTWQEPTPLTTEAGTMVRAKPIVLADGDYLLPIYRETGNDPERVGPDTTSLFLRYDVKMKRWSESNRIRSRLGNLQPSVAALTDTHLVCYCRRGGDYKPRTDGYLVRSESHDGGRIWSPGSDSSFPNPNAAADLLRLRNGHLLLVYNDSMSRRTPLTAALSTDGDKSYPHRRNLIQGPGDYAYPFAIQTRDSMIHVVYTSDQRSVINHAVFEESAILQEGQSTPQAETTAGWVKYSKNPVLGGNLGTCFDVSVLHEGNRYRMWFSWRPKKSIALVESSDGVQWSKPLIVLGPNEKTDWEKDLNRPVVLKNGDRYQMWYTGQARGKSWIGYATSPDGKSWQRMSDKPVLSAEKPWEKVAVMCPHVLYDDKTKLYRMWYSGGEQNEPNAIGYATSQDGLNWTKYEKNPVFNPDPKNAWERDRVTGCQVLRRGDWHLMFYIGFRDESHAQIGVARSRDGITGWQRHPANPIIRPGRDQWDHDAVYKPYAIFDGRQWLLWYNGRKGGVEQIGLALHEGEELGF